MMHMGQPEAAVSAPRDLLDDLASAAPGMTDPNYCGFSNWASRAAMSIARWR
ncbi:hypothetical protein [Antarctobacter sp.]|uniref:hypothetical protein n=1 Tax=Antarctobacter sp. TaxID=1872577 RepID=UPI002B2716A9|nr:hypothetical protein [Antarctobacter sp.]